MSGSDNGQSLELYSTVSTKKMLKIEKKGDFSINQSALIQLANADQDESNEQFLIIYSDCKDTQVFLFESKLLKLRKLTHQICQKANMKALPSVTRIFKGLDKVYLLTADLVLLAIDLSTLTLDSAIFDINNTLTKHFDD